MVELAFQPRIYGLKYSMFRNRDPMRKKQRWRKQKGRRVIIISQEKEIKSASD